VWLPTLLLAEASSLPHLQKTGPTVQMIVDGQPYLMLAGELHNPVLRVLNS
jgi:hypothetical protein